MTHTQLSLSIVIPSHNSSNTIEECIRSVLAQNLSSFELILVDDGSTDQTISIVEEMCKRYPQIHILARNHEGVSAARNAGLELAKGEFLVFLDSDDLFQPDSFNQVLETIQKNSLDMVFFESHVIETAGLELKNKKIFKGRPEHLYHKVVSGDRIFCESILADQFIEQPCMYIFRREAFSEVRFFEGYVYEDSIFTVELLLLSTTLRMMLLPDRIYIRRTSKTSITQRKPNRMNYESYLHAYYRLSLMYLRSPHSAVGFCINRYRRIFAKEAVSTAVDLQLSFTQRFLLFVDLLLERGLKNKLGLFLRLFNR